MITPGANALPRNVTPVLDLMEILKSAEVQDHGTALLVITPDVCQIDSLSLGERMLWVVSERQLRRAFLRDPGATPFRLPIIDGAFSVAIVHRLVRPGVDVVPLLEEAVRTLASDGQLLVVTEIADLASAPLPRGAQAHLIRRALRSVGVTNARFVDLGTSVIAVADRPSPTAHRGVSACLM